MIPGPVFQFELLTTARRGRFYALRASYAAALLLVFWAIHADWSSRAYVEMPVSQMSWLAIVCFGSVAVVQMVLVLSLTPALVAGVIADERQRRTLHYLLASRLTGPEIVIGKLFARLLHIAVLLIVGFPILSLLILLGGIDPRLIALTCGAAASTAWFLATLSIWVSTIARRARDAMFIAYGLEFLWLFLPTLIGFPPSSGWPPLDWLVHTILDAWRVSSPINQAFQSVFGLQTGSPVPFDELGPMIAYQAGGGLVLASIAAIQLRAIFRAQEGGGGLLRWRLRLGKVRRPPRLWSRPVLGDRPMHWKEMYTARTSGFIRLIGLLITLILGGFLLYYTVGFGALAFQERWFSSPDAPYSSTYPEMHRWQFWAFLQAVVPLVYLAGLLVVAGAAAAAITSEHEEDTWTSLTATDLTAREIIMAKLLGALWRSRAIVAVILLMALAGVVCGAIHVWSLLPLCLALTVFGWFAAALGLFISLQLRSTWRAQFLTTSSLLLVSLLGQAILSNVQRWAPLLWPGFTPYDISKTLLSTAVSQEWSEALKSWSPALREIDNGMVWLAIFWVLSLLCYLAGGIGLTWLCLWRFDAVAGRAVRGKSAIPSSQTPPTPSHRPHDEPDHSDALPGSVIPRPDPIA